jgi:hypothetical protein
MPFGFPLERAFSFPGIPGLTAECATYRLLAPIVNRSAPQQKVYTLFNEVRSSSAEILEQHEVYFCALGHVDQSPTSVA